MLKLYGLTTEYKDQPIGLDEAQPRFSWKLGDAAKGTHQLAYQVRVSNGEPLWDSGRVESGQSTLVEYMGQVLAPRTAYTWEVTVWTDQGESACASSSFETGLLSGTALEGKAEWITHGFDPSHTACPVFSKTFAVTKPISHARLYATAYGVYEASCNGAKIDDTYFAPGWTSYHKRLQYQTYALSLKQGENTLSFTLGNGWYKGALGFTPTPCHYGDTTALLALAVITYADGSEDLIGTDESWSVQESQIRFSEIYDGEIIDTTMPAMAPEKS